MVSEAIWPAGRTSVAVVMITLNEGHNLEGALQSICGWASEVFIVDSFSADDTVDIALRYGAHIVQRKFKNFGDQWNFALEYFPIKSAWTMKLDPDERVTTELKKEISVAIERPNIAGIEVWRRWWLLGRPLPIKDRLLRVWRTGSCRFSGVAVNEHPIVSGDTGLVRGYLEHLDSPNLEHWIAKQNKYSSAEAVTAINNDELAEEPKLLGNSLQRRMFLKKVFFYIPGRYQILFLYFYFYKGLWKAGSVGFKSSYLWTQVYRWREIKVWEMRQSGVTDIKVFHGTGDADNRVETIKND